MQHCRDEQIYVIGIDEEQQGRHLLRLTFHTTRGDFSALARRRHGMRSGVVLLSGERGGYAGPSAIYPELAEELLSDGVASLIVDFRDPGDRVQCTIDALLAVQYLDDEGISDVGVVGWSFGGATAIAVGALARSVRGVAAISTFDLAGCCVRRLRNKPLLLIHGDADSVSPLDVSRRIYLRSGEPRSLYVYPGVGHDMAEGRDRLRGDLHSWLVHVLQPARAAA
jgi:pimeloyl-ACP methyl ester carboxylesterase